MDVWDIARSANRLNFIVHVFMFLLFFGWGIFFTYCLVKFRAKSGGRALYEPVKAKISKYIEIGVLTFEIIILFAISIPGWRSFKKDLPAEGEGYAIRVTAQQFMWNVLDPGVDGVFGARKAELVSDGDGNPLGIDRSDPAGRDDVVMQNKLTIPAGRKILMDLTSKDVIHSFGIHHMSVKHDAVPGQDVKMWFSSDKTSAEIREKLAEKLPVSKARLVPGAERFTYMLMEDQAGLPKGTILNEENVATLEAAGVKTVLAAPEVPVQVACSQLCGLGHYKMRALVEILPEAEFKAWKLKALKDEISFGWEKEQLAQYLSKWSREDQLAFLKTWDKAEIHSVFDPFSVKDLKSTFHGWSPTELKSVFGRG